MEWFLSRALIIVPRGLLARNGDNKNATERRRFAFENGAGKIWQIYETKCYILIVLNYLL
jgi:hypothetical protein